MVERIQATKLQRYILIGKSIVIGCVRYDHVKAILVVDITCKMASEQVPSDTDIVKPENRFRGCFENAGRAGSVGGLGSSYVIQSESGRKRGVVRLCLSKRQHVSCK